DRAGLDPASRELEKALRLGAQNPEISKLEIRAEGLWVGTPEPAIEPERWLHQRRLEPLGQIGLEDVPGENVFPNARHGGQVAPVGERGAEADRLGILDVGDRIGWGGREGLR